MESVRARRIGTGVVVLATATLASNLLGGAAWSMPTRPSTLTVVAATSTPGSSYIPGTHCRAFPANNIWHADISGLPVNAKSAQWMAHMSPTRRLHADFGPAFGEQPVPYGIPITVVNRAPRVRVRFGYADESDRALYPLSTTTRIEGGWNAAGDRHAIVVDAATCTLFETWDTHKYSSRWYAGSGALWSLTSNALRPPGWTSADAAGLPILPGLLRYDEVAAGHVDHAIRFTTNVTNQAFVWPARHQAGSVTNSSYPPMGARFRLRASFSLTGYSAQAQVVLRAMKTYGLILADNGSPWYFQGTSDTRWQVGIIEQLGRVPASAFEAVDESSLAAGTNTGQVRG